MKQTEIIGRKLGLIEEIFSIVRCKDKRWKQITFLGIHFKIRNNKYKDFHVDLNTSTKLQFEGGKEPEPQSTYNKEDILFFAVISYSIRYQRPQQIADYYARNGHRVFYFNADFGIGQHPVIKETHKNLFEVTLCFNDLQNIYAHRFDKLKNQLTLQLDELLEYFNIADAAVISEYPNWIDAIMYLKHRYAITDCVDYLDDWDGFENTVTTELIQTTKEYLDCTDMIIATSEYLFNKAKKHIDNVVLVRNGTEFSHFHQIYGKNDLTKEKPLVGYYGAISHWFDVDKVISIAKQLPDVQVELIGQIGVDLKELPQLPNVKLLGEKPYKELPELISNWDVCLIPFDTSTDLIKATNPVKFYEYLSAGKKVVATEIPEIEEFKDKFVLLSNDTDQFVEYVRMCIDGKDNLASADEMVAFAKENDWSNRIAELDRNMCSIVPKFSIIVLTYNNLSYTKACLNSILEWTAYPNYELIVVDNASNDGTIEYLKDLEAKNEKVKVIFNNSNLGFAAGNNVGLKSATGEFLVLLNNDTIISKGWLSRILAHFKTDANIGVIGAVTNSIGNEAMVQTHYTDLRDFVREAKYRMFRYPFKSMTSESSLAMFAFAFTRTIFNSVGYLSEEYGRGMFEDDDYCMAVKAAGFRMIIAEDVLIHHFLSVSFGEWDNNEEKKQLFERNKAIFEKKWNTVWQMHSYRKGMDASFNNPTTLAYPKILKEAECLK